MPDTVYLLAILAALAAAALLWRWSARRQARRVLDQQKAIYSGKLEYAAARPADFPWLDAYYYEGMAAALAEAGFRAVGDFECLTLSRQFPALRTFLRCFIGDEGATMAAVYQIRLRGFPGLLGRLGLLPRVVRAVEFESEFVGGTFLSTNNLAGRNVFTECPGVETTQLPPATSWADVLAVHRQALWTAIREGGRQPRLCAGPEDVLAAQDRLHELKSAHRRAVGYVTREEFAALAGGELTAAQEKFVADFERRREEDERRPGGES